MSIFQHNTVLSASITVQLVTWYNVGAVSLLEGLGLSEDSATVTDSQS